MADKKGIESFTDIKNRQSIKEIIKSHMSEKDMKAHPEISALNHKIKKLRFTSITNLRPKLTSTKDTKDNKKIKLINNINSFRNIFYEFNKSQKYPQKEKIKIYKGEKNYDFYEKYKTIKKKQEARNKELLEDIENLYIKKNMPIPSINKDEQNLFNANLLILKEKNIKNSILYHLISEKSNEKSVGYFKRMQHKIDNQLYGKQMNLPQISNLLDGYQQYIDSGEIIKYNIDESKKKKIIDNIDKNSLSEYENKIRETMKSMDDIDYFFDSNNNDYFNHLKSQIKLKNDKNDSKYSTRVNSGQEIFPQKNDKLNYSLFNTINSYALKKSNKYIINRIDQNKKNRSSLNIFETNEINTKKEENNNRTSSFVIDDPIKNENKNKTENNIIDLKKKTNLIEIKKVNLNDKKINPKSILNLSPNKNNKNKNIKVQIVEKPIAARQRSSINYNELKNSLEKLSKLKYSSRKSMPYIFRPKPVINLKSNLENLYDKIKNKDDLLEYDFLIKNYLKNSQYDLEPKLSPNDISSNLQKIRKKIVRDDFLSRNIRLRKICGMDDKESFTKIKSDYEENKNKIYSVCYEMNEVFSNITNTLG